MLRGAAFQRALVRLLCMLVRLYQLFLRPVLGPNCRFTPSCSEYALEALALHGPARGTALAAGRVLRCNPWCEGGHDPVPRASPATPSPFNQRARLRPDGQ